MANAGGQMSPLVSASKNLKITSLIDADIIISCLIKNLQAYNN